MNCREFEERLLVYIDGELRGADASGADAHAEACPDCQSRAAFERALEDRIGAALLADADAAPPDVAELLRRAHPGATVAAAPGARGRLLSLRRMVVAAAGLLIAVQAAWFFCIPPFECSYLQAVEAAAVAPGDTNASPRSERLVGLHAPAQIGDYTLQGSPELVLVGYDGIDYAVRARYSDGTDGFSVLWCDPLDAEPSFRRRIQLDGFEWWIADENGRNLVAWMCPVTDTMCTLVGDIPEERLVSVASGMRDTGMRDTER